MSPNTALQTLRDKAGLTQAGLAKKLKTSTNYIGAIEREERRPGLDLACKIETWSGGKIPASSWSATGATVKL